MPKTAVAAGEQGSVLSTYLSPREADAVRARAEAADRTVSAELRRALRQYLKDERRPTEGGAVEESGGHSRHGEA